ncbi:hypothetical protein ACTL6P_12810 [Endozoicomonas acroporae]|uniref:hypothetical protein n=1 Tax=Endozoicomonas acroporae TaxID=1701104 RepID=UPI0013D3C37B|nr:hypothetical protein [Endozoicomonas acroporae]
MPAGIYNFCREKYFAQPFLIPEGGAKYFHAPWAFVVAFASQALIAPPFDP